MIETKRLILRYMNQADAEDIFRIWSNPMVNQYLWDTLYASVEEVKKVIGSVGNNDANHSFVVIYKENNAIIGTCGIGAEGTEGEWGFGYALEPKSWGNGYATELLQALIQLAREHGIQVVVGEAATDNPQSSKVMVKNGLKYDNDGLFTKADGSVTFKSKIYKLAL